MEDFSASFNDSYDRLMRDPHEFFEAFYANFMSKDPRIRAMFDQVDMKKQQMMLKKSLAYMINFAATKVVGDYLIDLSKRHHEELKVSDEMYVLWIDALVETVAELDESFDKSVEMGCRVAMSPGLEFMKHYFNN